MPERLVMRHLLQVLISSLPPQSAPHASMFEMHREGCRRCSGVRSMPIPTECCKPCWQTALYRCLRIMLYVVCFALSLPNVEPSQKKNNGRISHEKPIRISCQRRAQE